MEKIHQAEAEHKAAESEDLEQEVKLCTRLNAEAKLNLDQVRVEGRRQRTPEEKALIWKQDLRIVPISAGIYLLCYLDRSNIGMQSSTIAKELLTCSRKCENTQCQHA